VALVSPGNLAAQQSGSQGSASQSSGSQSPSQQSPSQSPTSGGQVRPGAAASASAVVAIPAPQKPKLDRYKGHVLAFNLAQITVQSDTNAKFIWSFQYSPELRNHVIELLNTGGYRYGDRVQVYCTPGTTVAVRIKGKPSGSGSS